MSTTSRAYRPKKMGSNKFGPKREGDWKCTCGADCFSTRTDCYKCGASKPSNSDGYGETTGRRDQRKEKREVKRREEHQVPSFPKKVITKLNMRNMMSGSPPQQNDDFLSFITSRFTEHNSLTKLSTQNDICEWLGFSTEEKHCVESFINCKKDQIETIRDYISARHHILEIDVIEDILNTLVTIKEGFCSSKVENDVVRTYYTYMLNDMVKVKQGSAKLPLNMKMKTLCIYTVIRKLCESRNISTNMAQ